MRLAHGVDSALGNGIVGGKTGDQRFSHLLENEAKTSTPYQALIRLLRPCAGSVPDSSGGRGVLGGP